MLAGRDASRALAKMSLDVADVDDPHVDDLTAEENKTLDEWIEKLGKKYPVLGNLVAEGEAAAAAGEGKGEGCAGGATETSGLPTEALGCRGGREHCSGALSARSTREAFAGALDARHCRTAEPLSKSSASSAQASAHAHSLWTQDSLAR